MNNQRMRSISRASGPASASVRAHTQTTSGMRNMLTTGLVMLLLPADSAFVPRANGHVAFSRSCYSPMLTSASLAGVQLRSYSAHEIVSEFCRPTVESLSLLLRLRGGGAAPTDAANRRATDAPLEKAGRSARNGRSLHQRAIAWLQSKPKQWYARALLFAFYARVPFLSIFSDEWAAVRSADIETKASIAAEIIRRRRRGAKVQKLIGVGYTPRIVALAGLMLRSLHLSTSLPAIWNPPIGLGAGACLAAQWAQREWLACLMVGWFLGGAYWSAMGVEPPSEFGGVPVFVQRVRF